MSDMTDQSPLTDTDINWDDPNEVFEIVWFRATSTDAEWSEDPASQQWDLSREEASRRLVEEDYTSPLPL